MNDGSKKEKEEKMKDKGPNHVLEEKKDKKEIFEFVGERVAICTNAFTIPGIISSFNNPIV